jgi:hypothetical protein
MDMHPTAVDDPLARTRPPPSQRYLVLAAAALSLCITTWSTAVVLMRNRGFDITDEGYYLLSYRWWNTNLRAATGAQYFYGPLFALVHHDIPTLRLLRLITVLLANAALGWAFMCWLRGRRPQAPESRWWEIAGALAVVAAGGMTFAWLPLSPGYNDATALGTVLGTALLFVIAHRASLPGRLALWPPVVLGAVCFGLVLAKWTSAGAVVILVAAAIILTRPRRDREVLRLLVGLTGGFVGAAAFVQLAVVRLDDAIPPMIEVNRLASQGEHHVGDILHTYLDTTRVLAGQTLRAHVLLFVAALLVSLTWNRRIGAATRVMTALLVIAAFLNSAWIIVRNGGYHGGPESIDQFSSALLAMSVTAALACAQPAVRRARTLTWSRQGVARMTVPVVLLALPLVQAFGTNGRLTSMAENAFGCWMALLVLLVTAVDPHATLVRRVATASIAAVAILAAVVPFDGLLNHPYRTAPYAEDTAVMAGKTPLGSLRLPPDQALQYAALRSALIPAFDRNPEPVQAFDKMPGLILLLGGRPVGEAWTGPTATRRSAAGLSDECRRGVLRRPPVLLYNRSPNRSDLDALGTCGFRLRHDLQVLPVPGGPPGLTVYVPR